LEVRFLSPAPITTRGFAVFAPLAARRPIQLNIQFQNRGRIAAMIVKSGREPRECGESSWPGRADIDHNFRVR
jgi:hypothetical protein